MKHLWFPLIFALIFAVAFIAKAAPTLSVDDAREKLREGAKLIDVRTAEEFASGRVSGAVNIPLDMVTNDLPRRFPDKSTTLLLHCRSGRRSGIAEKELRKLGYTNVFNIGSLERAQQVASQK